MNQQGLGSGLLALWFLVCTGLACDWNETLEKHQVLEKGSVDSGAIRFRISEVPDDESCKAACCKDLDCDLAVVEDPAGGGLECMLVTCVVQGRDVCVLQHNNSTLFRVYRRTRTTKTGKEAKTDGLKSRIVPLLGPWEPKTSGTSETSGTSGTNNTRCLQMMKVGFCRAAFSRFYYDVTNQSCRRFTYGGCGGNGNNFESEDECSATCRGVTGSVLPDDSVPPLPVEASQGAAAFRPKLSRGPDGPDGTGETHSSAEDTAERCGAEPQVGPCRAALQRWYFDRETGSCQSFIYGGCRGNKNNHVSQESCMAACTVTVLPSSKKVADDDDDDEEYKGRCTVAPEPGPCRAAFPMFYYDPDTASCQSFIYGGCHGNQNQYDTMEECMRRCSRNGVAEGRGRARNRWTAGIFLFVTLAAISALLLAALIVVTLRRHGLSRRPSSVSDKEELLPDPDEQSSVDSLSVPESPRPDQA